MSGVRDDHSVGKKKSALAGIIVDRKKKTKEEKKDSAPIDERMRKITSIKISDSDYENFVKMLLIYRDGGPEKYMLLSHDVFRAVLLNIIPRFFVWNEEKKQMALNPKLAEELINASIMESDLENVKIIFKYTPIQQALVHESRKMYYTQEEINDLCADIEARRKKLSIAEKAIIKTTREKLKLSLQFSKQRLDTSGLPSQPVADGDFSDDETADITIEESSDLLEKQQKLKEHLKRIDSSSGESTSQGTPQPAPRPQSMPVPAAVKDAALPRSATAGAVPFAPPPPSDLPPPRPSAPAFAPPPPSGTPAPLKSGIISGAPKKPGATGMSMMDELEAKLKERTTAKPSTAKMATIKEGEDDAFATHSSATARKQPVDDAHHDLNYMLEQCDNLDSVLFATLGIFHMDTRLTAEDRNVVNKLTALTVHLSKSKSTSCYMFKSEVATVMKILWNDSIDAERKSKLLDDLIVKSETVLDGKGRALVKTFAIAAACAVVGAVLGGVAGFFLGGINLAPGVTLGAYLGWTIGMCIAAGAGVGTAFSAATGGLVSYHAFFKPTAAITTDTEKTAFNEFVQAARGAIS